MPPGKQPTVELLTQGYAGANTALQFSQLSREQSPSMQNAYQSKLGAIAKRPGTIPVTTVALNAPINRLMVFKATPTNTNQEILASSGTTLYKYNGTNAFIAQTMTNPLNTSDIYDTDFTNSVLSSIKFIADQSSMKRYNGTDVANITPAPDDPAPNPPNDLNDINAKKPKFCWTYSGHIFVSPGNNEVFYSKRYEYDYWPSVQWFLLVRDNDFVNGCGISFNNVCLIPMRRGWGILTGQNFDNFDASMFLNTVSGVIAPRSIAKITRPDGTQSIVYLSDDGVHEVYDTGILDTGTRQYSTRALMKDKIDFMALGLTEAEKEASIGYFDGPMSLYFLTFNRDGVNTTYVYDVRNGEWYPDWTGFTSKSYIRIDDVVYFGGSSGYLHKFDENLYSDWTNAAKTVGTPVHFKRYSPLLSLEYSGYASYWDYFLLEARQFLVPSSIDLQVIFSNETATDMTESPWKLNVAVYGSARYGVSRYANLQYTDIVNAPQRLVFKRKSKYIQVLLENNRDEPVEIFKDLWIGRTSGQ